MARQDTLSIYLSNEAKDKLIETYGEVVDMVQKQALSVALKNQNFSGDPASGSVEIRRLLTSASQAYGTARTAGEGDKVHNTSVIINIDQDKEIVEEIESKDVDLYGIPDIIEKRKVNHQLAMTRELDRAFFAECESAGSEVTLTATTIVGKVEEMIQDLETTSNSNVDGVDRESMALVLTPEYFGALETYIDTLPNPNGGGLNVNLFHRVRVYSNTRQTEDAILMVVGAVAQPITATPYEAEKIPLSNAVAVELFYSYGTQAVMADLIRYADLTEEEISA